MVACERDVIYFEHFIKYIHGRRSGSMHAALRSRGEYNHQAKLQQEKESTMENKEPISTCPIIWGSEKIETDILIPVMIS